MIFRWGRTPTSKKLRVWHLPLRPPPSALRRAHSSAAPSSAGFSSAAGALFSSAGFSSVAGAAFLGGLLFGRGLGASRRPADLQSPVCSRPLLEPVPLLPAQGCGSYRRRDNLFSRGRGDGCRRFRRRRGSGGRNFFIRFGGVAIGHGWCVVAPPADGLQQVAGCVQQVETGWQHTLARLHFTGLQQHFLRAWASLPENANSITTQMTAANFLMVQPHGPFE